MITFLESDFDTWFSNQQAAQQSGLSSRLPGKKGITRDLKKTGFETEFEPVRSKPRSVSKDPKRESDPNVLSEDSLSSSMDEEDIKVVSE